VISEQQTHIDVYQSDWIEKLQKLPQKGKYLVHFWHGSRSQYVLQVMQEL